MKRKTSFYAYITFSFMGIIIHEFSHKLFCQLVGVKVFKVKYFQLKNPAGYVEHAQPKNFIQAFFISVGPFIFGTILSLSLFWFAVSLWMGERPFAPTAYNSPLTTYNLLLTTFSIWFGLAIATHCFPSSGDARVLLSEANHHFFHRFNPLAALLYPFVLIIKLANYLKKFYFDWIYAILLLGLAIWIVVFLIK